MDDTVIIGDYICRMGFINFFNFDSGWHFGTMSILHHHVLQLLPPIADNLNVVQVYVATSSSAVHMKHTPSLSVLCLDQFAGLVPTVLYPFGQDLQMGLQWTFQYLLYSTMLDAVHNCSDFSFFTSLFDPSKLQGEHLFSWLFEAV